MPHYFELMPRPRRNHGGSWSKLETKVTTRFVNPPIGFHSPFPGSVTGFHTAEPSVVRRRVDFAFAARADHVARAVLVGA